MASYLDHNISNNSRNATTIDTAVLDAFIPGYSVLSRFLVSYLQIDLSYYLPFLVMAAAATASLRYSIKRIIRLLGEHFTSTAEIRLDDEIYNYLMFWMAQQPFTKRTTHFVAGTKISSGMRYWDSDNGEGSDDEDMCEDDDDTGNDNSDMLANFDRYWQKVISKDKYRTLRFTPAEGTHYFWYKARPLAFIREREENNGGVSLRWVPERLYLSCLGRDPSILKELLADAQRAYVARDGNRTIIYRGQKSGVDDFDWVRCMARPPRPLSTVVLDEAQKQAFIDDIKEYLHPRTRRWYSNRGIPYRRGTCCTARRARARRVCVLRRDVDSAGITQKRAKDDSAASAVLVEKDKSSAEEKEPETKTNKGVSLSGLLNVIDGVAASEGRILIMTTNHAEKLDPALLRPGRVDMTIAFGYADRNAMRELFSAIYSMLEGDARTSQMKSVRKASGQREKKHAKATATQWKRQRLSKEKIAELASEFASRIPEGEFTAAEIQGHLLNYKNEPEAAINAVEEWVRSVRAKRKEKEQSK
ncbi:putative BCS1-like ATPase [Aspergillus novofumigatus IBT 16806]|uniref:Putative BCS1-like ATPase n=1 Tax=Aspergillus novofumigatus (strain IBT 16806) TaxID=1392255 RepID=A0A2I1CNV6_ASPN1|nr:putative BCS1-like ATPase [Aspergillus novofumigatus IBT 16806]PKX99301.1 putative BCS1-like ATPase [Aspergillus novofumigatus IBT 16806]